VEGAQSGSDLTSGIKRYQAVNQGKFVRKWGDALKFQPPPQSEITLAALYGLAVRDRAVGTPT